MADPAAPNWGRIPLSPSGVLRRARQDREYLIRGVVALVNDAWVRRYLIGRRPGDLPHWFEGKPLLPVREPVVRAIAAVLDYRPKGKDAYLTPLRMETWIPGVGPRWPAETASSFSDADLLVMVYDAHAFSDAYPYELPQHGD